MSLGWPRNVLVTVLADRETQANPYPLWQVVERSRPRCSATAILSWSPATARRTRCCCVARARADAEPAFTAAVDAIAEERFADAELLLPLARRIESSRALRTSNTRVCVLEGRVLSGAEPLPLRERELELVVALALERRPLTREALVSRMWPDIAADEATAALRTAVYRLRKQLRDPGAVVSTAAGYRLAATVPVDLLEAEQFVVGAARLGALSERERTRLTAMLERLSDGLPTVYARWDWFTPYEQRTRDLLHAPASRSPKTISAAAIRRPRSRAPRRCCARTPWTNRRTRSRSARTSPRAARAKRCGATAVTATRSSASTRRAGRGADQFACGDALS